MYLEKKDSPVRGQFLQISVHVFTTTNGRNVAAVTAHQKSILINHQ